MTVLGLIPARKGSKRLPGKNTRLLGGRPLIVWTIEAARKSRRLTHLVCSTDDDAVMRICVKMGVDVIVRPAELATDAARSEDVALHALEIYPTEYLCLLQPTSPFRTDGDIDACVERAIQHDCCVSMVRGADVNGAVYVASAEHLRRDGFACGCLHFMPPERSIDIDTIDDFQKAEAMVREGFAV